MYNVCTDKNIGTFKMIIEFQWVFCNKYFSELSKETLQSLLELICFFNSEDTLDEDFIEEKKTSLNLKQRTVVRSWK